VDLFGWSVNKYLGPTVYYLLGTIPIDDKTRMPVRPRVNGALYERKSSSMPEMAKPTNNISVESVEEFSKKVKALGGKILVEKMEIPKLGWWVLALDPEGNPFGMLEYMQN
jgi:predicted enzyme related to lactoylglutathione lyase